MSQEHVEAVGSVYERWAQGDFRASVEVFDPLVLFVLRPEFPEAGTYLGLEEVAAYTRALLAPWKQFTIAAEEITAVGDSVVVALVQRGIGNESGTATELRYFHVWTFRGDKAIRLESIRERADAFEAVGGDPPKGV